MTEKRVETVLGVVPDVRSGPPLSFTDFFNDEQARLFRALYLVTGNRQEAEEALQDAFVRIWERWDAVAVMRNPTGYLYTTALNTWRMRYRSAVRAARRSFSSSAPTDPFAEIDMREDVRNSLAGLTSRQRAALVLTEMLGYSSRDAAAVLGVRDSTVRVLANHGRKTLRDSMEDPRV